MREMWCVRQSGFALIEVVVSAALLMVVAGGVLAGIDGPANVSGKNETRSQAAALAQQDQERLRSKPISYLNGYQATNTVTVGTPPVSYAVFSKATWVRDNNDSGSCTISAEDTSGDYLRITSRVTPPAAGSTPVELNSLLSPPPGTYTNNTGTLTVRLTNQADAPVVAQSVSISGASSQTASTNSEGCAVFQNIPTGTYNISFSRGGWVDPSGANVVNRSTSVTTGAVTVVNHNYAQAGTISVGVDTKVGAAGPVTSPAKAVTISNQGIPTGTLTFNAPPTPAQGSSSFTLSVYPFTSGYGVWAGACVSADPTRYGVAAQSATPPAGGSASVTVRQPAIDLTLRRNNILYASSHVRVTNTDAGCGGAVTTATNSSGKLANPGFPYGNYNVCADDGSHYDQDPAVDTNPLGTAVALNIPTGSSAPQAGICP